MNSKIADGTASADNDKRSPLNLPLRHAMADPGAVSSLADVSPVIPATVTLNRPSSVSSASSKPSTIKHHAAKQLLKVDCSAACFRNLSMNKEAIRNIIVQSSRSAVTSWLPAAWLFLCILINTVVCNNGAVLSMPERGSLNLESSQVEWFSRIHVGAAHNLTAAPHGTNAGDFDGDGLLDTILGAPDAAPGGRVGAGAAYLIYGAGLVEGADIYLSDLADQGKGFAILGGSPEDKCGAAVGAAGDINGDGYGDLLVGCPGAEGGAGAVYILYGTSTVGVIWDITLSDSSGTTPSLAIITVVHGAVKGGELGAAVRGVGDVNGDGFEDLALTAPSAAVGDRASAGIVYLILGSADGLPVTINLTTTEHSQYVVQLRGELAGDRAGHYIESAGDLNGDGFADFVVGTNRTSLTGVAYVVYGRATMHVGEDQVLGSVSERVIQAYGLPHRALSVVGGRDVDADGLDDLLLTCGPSLNKADIAADGVRAVEVRAWYGGSMSERSIPYTDTVTVLSVPLSAEGSDNRLRMNSKKKGSIASALCITESDCGDHILGILCLLLRNKQADDSKNEVIRDCLHGVTAVGTEGNVRMCYLSEADDADGALLQVYCSARDGQVQSEYASAIAPSRPIRNGTSTHGHATILGTQNFAYTGSYQSFVVPVDIYALIVTLYGAAGGTYGSGQGGLGAMMKAQISVTPGETLRVYVGGLGPSSGTAGGFNGGGGRASNSVSGGGGGSTDIRRSPYGVSDRLVIAAGAGGGMHWSTQTCFCNGGNGGYPKGADGGVVNAGCSGSPKVPGRGGNQTFGGSGYGTGSGGLFSGGVNTNYVITPGGGGGYYGGGCGFLGGSGGGSSYSSTTPTDYDQGSVTGHGSAVIQYVDPPTASPTEAPTRPTASPTVAPTMPTANPTCSPTTNPTPGPTKTPTTCPTCRPTIRPTCAPTVAPTSPPSPRPSFAPTLVPSAVPSSRPSMQPTSQPTALPSAQPVGSPTSRPTHQETAIPSAQPTSRPSTQPTMQPALVPTARPSAQPSSQPTCQPILVPSAQPSAQPTTAPSASPTLQPTGRPSMQPSGTPTSSPSAQPSVVPSQQPLSWPTGSPTSQPTASPSIQPVAWPSSVPTMQPTTAPTMQTTFNPSSQPTMQPLAAPSHQPFATPSSQPSSSPSEQPTALPTCQPSLHPSGAPSAQPSRMPTHQPTNHPSCQPWSNPSAQPSMQPSGWPTDQPTQSPTCQPSSVPSPQPSGLPTNQPWSSPSTPPTTQPSERPSGTPTQEPSFQPSSQPSSMPTEQTAAVPSGIPSTLPSSQPSSGPSMQPTTQPSQMHTRQPSAQPTSQPSASPTPALTKKPSAVPTVQPSIEPSSLPSRQPTAMLTVQPTVNPSSQPLASPIAEPAKLPTQPPSASPSLQATAQPVSTISCLPSAGPSAAPSALVSSTPTGAPTVYIASQLPTVVPSVPNTAHPSVPTQLMPLSAPTTAPSASPILLLSPAPTVLPTETPTELQYTNVSVVNVTSLQTAMVVMVKTEGRDSAHIYCGAFRKIPAAIPLSAAIRAQGIMAYAAPPQQTVALTVSGLAPATVYTVLCTSVTRAGVALPESTVLQNAVAVTTLCCRKVQVSLLTTNVITGVLQRRAVAVTVDTAPEHALIVQFAFLAVNGTGASAITRPNVVQFANTSSGDALTAVVAANGWIVGTAELAVSLQGPDSARYEVQYLTGRVLNVLAATSTPAVPVLSGGRFSNDGSSVILSFDAPTNRGGYQNSFPCSKLLHFPGKAEATCQWEDTSHIVVYPGNVASPQYDVLFVGSNVTLLGGIVRAQCTALINATTCQSWPTMSAAAVTVQPPLSPVAPVVIITVPTIIGSCSSLLIDVTSSTGAAGRPWKSAQFQVTSGGGPPDAAQQLEIFLRSNYTISPPTAIPYAVFPKGVTYTIRATLCNFLWACGSGIAIVQVSSSTAVVPIVTIPGDSSRSAYRPAQLTVAADANMQSCTGVKSNRNLRYSWTLSALSAGEVFEPTNLMSTSHSERVFKLPPYTLSVGQQYLLQLSVQLTTASSSGSAQASVQITVLPSKLVASIAGGFSRYVKVGTSITIDASQSYDEDIAGQVGLTAGLRYTWSCVQLLPTFSIVCPLELPVTVENQERLSVFANVAALNTTASITVTVSDSTRSSSAEVQVKATSMKPPHLQITTAASALKRVNPSTRLKLLAEVQVYSQCLASWEIDDPAVSLTGATLTPVSKPLSANAIAPVPFNLVLLENTLQPRATYAFTLRCGPFAASVMVTTNGSPLPGIFIIHPDSGEALITLYTFSGDQWTDPDLPLTYQFGFESAVSLANLVVVSRSEQSYTSTTLPAGRADQDFKVTGSLEVYDSLAAVTALHHTVVVREVSPAEQDTALLALLNSSTGTADSMRTIISVASTTINSVNCTGATNCTALHREGCRRTSGECGPCLPGYIGDTGDRSTLCIPVLAVNATAFACSVTRACPERWQVCNLQSELCEPPPKTCSRNCSHNGHCKYVNQVTGTLLPSCRLDDSSCISVCSCVGGYTGAACELSVEALRFKRSVRSALMGSLLELTNSEDVNTETVSAWSSCLYSLSIRPYELSAKDVEAMSTIANTTLQCAINLGANSYAELLGVLQATDAAAALLKYNYNPNDFTEVAYNTSRNYVNNTAAAVVETVSAFGDLVSRSMVLGQNRTTLYYDNFRLAVDVIIATPGAGNISLDSPQSGIEALQAQRPTTLNMVPLANQTTTLSVKLITVHPRSYTPDTHSFVASPLAMQVQVHGGGVHQRKDAAVKALSEVVVAFQSINSHNEFLSDPGYNFTTVCGENGSVFAEALSYQCPQSGVWLHHNCSRGPGIMRSYCPRPAPTCAQIDTQTAAISSANSCRLVSYNTTCTVCACAIRATENDINSGHARQAPNLRGVPPSYDQRSLQGAEDETATALLDDTGAVSLLVSTVYIASDFADTFTVADDFTSPADASRVLVILIMLSAVWVPGLMAIGFAWLWPARKKSKGPTTALQDARESVMQYVQNVIPRTFVTDGTLAKRVWMEIQDKHSLFRLFSGMEQRKQMETICKTLTLLTFMLFLVAVFFDVSTPTNDGSCPTHLTEEDCLRRVSPFDYAQTYCSWDFTTQQDEPKCQYFHQSPSMKSLFYVTVLTTVLTSIATVPLDYCFSIISAPTANNLKGSRIAAVASTAASGARRVSEAGIAAARRVSVLANRAVMPKNPKKMSWSVAKILNELTGENQVTTRKIPEEVVHANESAQRSMVTIANNVQWLSLRQLEAERRESARSFRMQASVNLSDRTDDASSLRLAEATAQVGAGAMLLQSVLLQRQLLDGKAVDTKSFDAKWGVQRVGAAAKGEMGSYIVLPEAVEAINREVECAEETAQQLVEVLSNYSGQHSGLEVLHLFMVDLLGKRTAAAKIYQQKFGEEFEHSKVVRAWQKFLAIAMVIGLNGFFAYYIMLKAFQMGYPWQLRYLLCCVVQLIVELLVFETVECIWLHYSVPSFVRAEVAAAANKLTRLVEQVTAPADQENSHALRSRRNKWLFLNAPAHLFASVRLAKGTPHLLESMIVGAYTDHLPGEVCRTWPHYQRHLKTTSTSASSDISVDGTATWSSAVMRGLVLSLNVFIAAPYIYQRIILRFAQPIAFAGFGVLWANLGSTIQWAAGVGLLLAVFLAYQVYSWYAARNKSARVVPHEDNAENSLSATMVVEEEGAADSDYAPEGAQDSVDENRIQGASAAAPDKSASVGQDKMVEQCGNNLPADSEISSPLLPNAGLQQVRSFDSFDSPSTPSQSSDEEVATSRCKAPPSTACAGQPRTMLDTPAPAAHTESCGILSPTGKQNSHSVAIGDSSDSDDNWSISLSSEDTDE